MKTQKKLIRLKKDDLSWFDIERYEPLKNLGLEWWAGSLMLRYLLLSQSQDKPNRTINENLLKVIPKMMICPVPDGENHKERVALFANGRPRIWDITVLDVYLERFSLEKEEFQDVLEIAQKWSKGLDDSGKFSPCPELLDSSFDDFLISRGFDHYRDQMVNVDLNATDEQLISDFTDWLAEKRKKRSSMIPKKNVGTKDVQEWIKYQVLALIDLDIFCAYTKTTIAHSTLGSLLFPDEYDVDLSERVRKVVRPMAKTLMSSSFLGALDNQMAVTERKKQKNIPE